MSVNVNMKELLEAGVHYGHQTRRWNPKMSQYIFGERNGIHIIDLQKTVDQLKKACDFLEDVSRRGGHVLFVGTKRLARDMVSEGASSAGMYYINHRWLGGTLTNFQTMRQSIHRLKKITRMSQDGTFQKLTKKECLGLQRELDKLECNLGGIKNMPGLPSAIFVTDAHKEQIAISEARKLGIPVVAIADTNSDPTLADLAIPGNDDSAKSLKLFITAAAKACAIGREKAKYQKDDEDAAHAKGDSAPQRSSFRDEKGNKVSVEKK